MSASSNKNAFAGLWTSLPTSLTPWVLDVIDGLGYTQMTPVQASTIPAFMRNKDVVVEAVTGSGKTIAFVVPILEKLIRRESRLRKREIGALVITPTRELATQIHFVFEHFLSSQPTLGSDSESDDGQDDTPKKRSDLLLPPSLLLVSSSESTLAQDIQRFLEIGADIVIGTPGRVEEFLLGKGSAVVGVRELEVLVLDEADRLLDSGFSQSLTRIITALPKQRRTGLFSATMTDALDELVRVGLRNAVRVVVTVEAKKTKDGKLIKEKVEERRIPATLKNQFILCRASEKLVQLLRIIERDTQQNQLSRFIVYFGTCACVDYFYRVLPSFLPNYSFHSLHGHLPPSKRTKTLESFVSHSSSYVSPAILLCTDVAARGLDLPDVDCVIQFDPPADTKQFSHRCGRTARAGKSGKAWTLLTEKEVGFVDFLDVRKIPMKPHPYLSASDAAGQSSSSAADCPAEDPQAKTLMTQIRSFVLQDRDLHDKAAKAFVSFVKAYSKHEASFIFRLKDLDLIGLAKCFGLLKLPSMPEFKGRDPQDWSDADVDWTSYAYADRTRETHRLASIPNKGDSKARDVDRAHRREQKQKNAAWSDKVRQKDTREMRREKKGRKKEWLKQQAEHRSAEPGNSAAVTGRKRSPVKDDDDWDDLAREERLAKKVKKGTVEQKAFDAEFADL